MIAALTLQSASGASAPILDIDPSKQYDFNESHGNGMIGWTFHLLQPVTITQVGWYDEGADGLSRPFQVGLWQGEENPMDSRTPLFRPESTYLSLIGDPVQGVTIPSGSGASLNGVWRVVDLGSPLSLQPGYYELGGVDTANTPDVIKYVMNPRPPGSPLDIGLFFYPWTSQEAGLHVVGNDGFYLFWGLELGPMLFTPVPEPSTVSLICLAGLGVAFQHFLSNGNSRWV